MRLCIMCQTPQSKQSTQKHRRSSQQAGCRSGWVCQGAGSKEHARSHQSHSSPPELGPPLSIPHCPPSSTPSSPFSLSPARSRFLYSLRLSLYLSLSLSLVRIHTGNLPAAPVDVVTASISSFPSILSFDSTVHSFATTISQAPPSSPSSSSTAPSTPPRHNSSRSTQPL